MTTRYLQLPTHHLQIISADDGLPTVVDPASGERKPTRPTSHQEIARALTNQIRTDDGLDVLDCMSLRMKLTRPGGTSVELSEAEHAALVKAAKSPRVLSLHAQFSPDVNAFLRAIVDATSKPPKSATVDAATVDAVYTPKD